MATRTQPVIGVAGCPLAGTRGGRWPRSLMRRDRTAPNGLTDFMVASAIEAAPGLGVRRLSLNFAVLRSVFARAEDLGAGPVLRLWSGSRPVTAGCATRWLAVPHRIPAPQGPQ